MDQSSVGECLDLLKTVLKDDLLGVYLFGSAVTNGLQRYSDLDIFVISNRPTTLIEKRRLFEELLGISGIYMKSEKRSIELTIVEKDKVNPWKYPPICDFQYGEWLRESFLENTIDLSSSEMPDLAVVITQILEINQRIYGTEAKELLSPVPYSDFIHAMARDLPRLSNEILTDTRNVLLTGARIWSTVVTGTIKSKSDAVDWALPYLPTQYKPLLRRAKQIYIGKEEEYWHDVQHILAHCFRFITEEIKKNINHEAVTKRGF
jgi:predicted nucleotidyltransferase